MANNESLLDRQVNPDPPKDNRRKLKFIFVAIVSIGLGAVIGNNLYIYWQRTNSLNQLAQQQEEADAKAYGEKMADTYGGKTPAETLRLYIDAVKKGDYELASKYFVAKDQAEDLIYLKDASAGGLAIYINNVETTYASIENGIGGYSSDKKEFGTIKPFFSEFVLYPNGIWKLIKQ